MMGFLYVRDCGVPSLRENARHVVPVSLHLLLLYYHCLSYDLVTFDWTRHSKQHAGPSSVVVRAWYSPFPHLSITSLQTTTVVIAYHPQNHDPNGHTCASMKSEAVDAMTTRTMRPTALDAAAMPNPEEESKSEGNHQGNGIKVSSSSRCH